MAVSQHTPNNRPIALTSSDIGSLADRLLARGVHDIRGATRDRAGYGGRGADVTEAHEDA